LLHGLLQFGEPLECDYPNVGIAMAQGTCLLHFVSMGGHLHRSHTRLVLLSGVGATVLSDQCSDLLASRTP
jgi:hypothetical protein